VTAERIVVLGGSGFIGTRLVTRLLRAGHDVTIGDKAESSAFPGRWTRCDVRDIDALRRIVVGADVVINLAAEHRDDVTPTRLYDDVNVEGARHVCVAATESGVRRVVFTSSVAVYGFSAAELDEDAATRPFNDYGRTKLEAEAVYEAWQRDDPGKTLVIMRPSVVFGEGNRGNVFNLVRQVASGAFVMVGEGTNRKSMAYVENVAACLEWSLTLRAGRHLFNYADKPDLDTNALVTTVRSALGRSPRPPFRLPVAAGLVAGHACDLISRVTGRKLPISAIRVKKFTQNTRIAATRIALAGFVPPVSLHEGLRRFLAADFPSGPRAVE
jgi:nucleoside-diphosphate-sugar epimerase